MEVVVVVARTDDAVADAHGLRRFAFGLVLGPVILAAGWLVLGLLRPGFSPLTQPISGLGVGTHSAWMNAAFLASGALIVVGLVGVFLSLAAEHPAVKGACLALLALSPIGGMLDGVFTYEAFFPHFVGFLVAVGVPVLGFPLAGWMFRRNPGWRRFGTALIFGGPFTLALTILFFLTFDIATTAANRGVAGLTERLLLLEVHGWFLAMGLVAIRRRGNF